MVQFDCCNNATTTNTLTRENMMTIQGNAKMVLVPSHLLVGDNVEFDYNGKTRIGKVERVEPTYFKVSLSSDNGKPVSDVVKTFNWHKIDGRNEPTQDDMQAIADGSKQYDENEFHTGIKLVG